MTSDDGRLVARFAVPKVPEDELKRKHRITQMFRNIVKRTIRQGRKNTPGLANGALKRSLFKRQVRKKRKKGKAPKAPKVK